MLFKNYKFVDPVLARKAIDCVDKWTYPVGVDYTVKEIIKTVSPGLYDKLNENDVYRVGKAVSKKYNHNCYHHIKKGDDKGVTHTYNPPFCERHQCGYEKGAFAKNVYMI